ncbi:hypothetical protein [Parabacteroides merdae]|uniref:Uncharacterized protein n=1 Tax=Parabacteroides merdae TaxID=46503 RepID=A0A7K1HJD8_9BACT|nr:hypothetical protein [Parabacteroides merdae]MTU30692.1 hypothetical protein [Parabacteroides merdae]
MSKSTFGEKKSIERFMHDCNVLQSEKEYVLLRDLYLEYSTYCKEVGIVPKVQKEFLRYMEKHCLVKRHCTNNQTRVYLKKSPCSCVSGLAVDEILQKNDLAAISESELLKPLNDKGTEEILITDKVDC